MIIIGLTGSIATGKSNIAKGFKRLNIPVFDADKAVYKIYDNNPILFEHIQENFPEAIVGNKIDRKIVARCLINNSPALKKLEEIIHPLVEQKADKFIQLNTRHRKKFIVLEVPLLFEVGRYTDCDYIITSTCSKFLQKQRALRRNKMTAEKLEFIRSKQTPDCRKILMADFYINTGGSKGTGFSRLKEILNRISNG